MNITTTVPRQHKMTAYLRVIPFYTTLFWQGQSTQSFTTTADDLSVAHEPAASPASSTALQTSFNLPLSFCYWLLWDPLTRIRALRPHYPSTHLPYMLEFAQSWTVEHANVAPPPSQYLINMSSFSFNQPFR